MLSLGVDADGELVYQGKNIADPAEDNTGEDGEYQRDEIENNGHRCRHDAAGASKVTDEKGVTEIGKVRMLAERMKETV